MDIKNGIDKIVSQVGKKDKLENLLYNSTGFNKLMSPVYNMRTALAVAHDAEDYGVDSYKTSYKYSDVKVVHENIDGSLKEEIADEIEFKLVYKGKECNSLRMKISPRIDYDLVVEYSVDGVKKQSVFNLKTTKAYEGGYGSLCVYNAEDVLSSLRIYTTVVGGPGYAGYNVLRTFLGVLYFYNPFENIEEKKAPNKVDNKRIDNIFNPLGMTFNSPSYSNKSIDDPYKELDNLIGLDSIKKDITNLTNFMKMQRKRKERGLSTVPVSLHLVFTGNPGTGKTTIARIIGALYKEIGVLSKGHFVEVDRSALVAGYVGQTAIKTQKKIDEAMGGVLFIDEAYTLAKPDSPNDFGQEAIDTILKAMEDSRDNFVVIVAGYPEPMKTFINSNPGLQSRFNKYIDFPDYTQEEMMQIFDKMCEQYEYTVDEEVREKMNWIIGGIIQRKDETFANARTVRNLFEKIITSQANRLAEVDASDEEMQRITVDDLTDL